MLPTHFFPLAHVDYWENIKAFVCLLLRVVWRRVTKVPLVGNSFETGANSEASQGGLF